MEDSIKDFIIDDVLSQYTFLFSQLQENTSPNGTYPLAYVRVYKHTYIRFFMCTYVFAYVLCKLSLFL